MASLEFTQLFNCAETVSCLSLSDNYLIFGLDNGNISLVLLNFPPSFTTLTHSTSPCNALAFSDANSDILYTAHDGNFSAWDLRGPLTSIFDSEVSEDEVSFIDVDVQDVCIAAGYDLGLFTLISFATQKVTHTFKNRKSICSMAKFRPFWQNQLISAGLDCQLVRDWKVGSRNSHKRFSVANLLDPHRFSSLLDVGDNPSDEHICIASPFSPEETMQMVTTRVLGQGFPINPQWFIVLVTVSRVILSLSALATVLSRYFKVENVSAGVSDSLAINVPLRLFCQLGNHIWPVVVMIATSFYGRLHVGAAVFGLPILKRLKP